METATIKADYEPILAEQYLQVFNQVDSIAHQQDQFFHQEGKIYSMTGDTLFHRADSLFHIVDNKYHQATDTNQKFAQAQELQKILEQQELLFQSAQDINTDRAASFHNLDNLLQQLTKQITNK